MDEMPSPLSHKSLRRQHKAITKSPRQQRKAVTKPQPEIEEPFVEKYECYGCLDEFSIDEGVITCAAHFLCPSCFVEAFKNAANGYGLDMFPAQCCGTLGWRLAEHLLAPGLIEAYDHKEMQSRMDPILRVYCTGCGSWQSPNDFSHDGAYMVAKCSCETVTCVACKEQWQEGHKCADVHEPPTIPDWMEPYSADCRVKRCPGCRTWIQLWDACNHMTCTRCGHNFCFVCLMPWEQFHEHGPGSCPAYGDPAVGYDEEGFEKSERGLHRDTGLNRQGLNREGQLALSGRLRGVGEQNRHQGRYRMWRMGDDGVIEDGFASDDESDDGYLDDQAPEVNQGYWWVPPENNNMAPDWGQDTDQGSDADHGQNDEPDEQPLEVQVEDYHTLNFDRIACQHNFSNHGGQEWCSVCGYFMPYYYYGCTTCELRVCEFCSQGFDSRLFWCKPWLCNFLNVIQWAEDGEPPFKALRRAEWREMQAEDAEWCIDALFDEYERMYLEAHPFMYTDIGIKDMFEHAEKDLWKLCWYVVEEDFGFPGLSMTVRMDGNAFAPLLWEDVVGEDVGFAGVPKALLPEEPQYPSYDWIRLYYFGYL